MLYISNLKEEMEEAPGQTDIFGGEIEGPATALIPRRIGRQRPGGQA